MRENIDRFEDGLRMYRAGCVTPETADIKMYRVRGNTDNYLVMHYMHSGVWECNCPDFVHREHQCKHIYSCIIKEIVEEE